MMSGSATLKAESLLRNESRRRLSRGTNGRGRSASSTLSLEPTIHALTSADQHLLRFWLMRHEPFRFLKNESSREMLLDACIAHAELRFLPPSRVLFDPRRKVADLHYLLIGKVQIDSTSQIEEGKELLMKNWELESKYPGNFPIPIGWQNFGMPVGTVGTAGTAVTMSRCAVLSVDIESEGLMQSLSTFTSRYAGSEAEDTEDIELTNAWIEKLSNHRWMKDEGAEFITWLYNNAELLKAQAGEVLQEFHEPMEFVYVLKTGSIFRLNGPQVPLFCSLWMLFDEKKAAHNGKKRIHGFNDMNARRFLRGQYLQ